MTSGIKIAGSAFSVGRTILACFLIFLCIFWAVPPVFAENDPSTGEDAQIVIYLELSESASDLLYMELASMHLEGRQDLINLPVKKTSFDTSMHTVGQILLSEAVIPPGDYKSLKLKFENIRAAFDGDIIELTDKPVDVTIEVNVRIPSGTARALFLKWSPELENDDNIIFTPRLSILQDDIPPSGALIFVANEGSDNITLINRFNYRVIDVIKTGRAPRGMVYSPLTQQLYVSNSGDNSVVVIDLNTRRILRTIQLNFGDEPSRLLLSPDEQNLYILNRGSNTLIVYDIFSFQEIDRATLGITPASMAIDRLSGYVYVSNLYSENIYIYRSVGQSAPGTIEIGGAPSEIIVDGRNKVMYLAHHRQRKLSLMDLSTGSITGTLNLCSPAVGLAYHPATRQLYAALGECSEIAILKPENEINLGQINLPDSPGLLTLDPESRHLMAVMPGSNRLAVINVINQELIAQIEVGERPYMAVIPE